MVDRAALPRVAALLLGLSAVLGGTGPAGAQQDLAAFRLTELSGTFSARYWLTEWEQSGGSGSDSFNRQPTWEEELTLRARAYVYHPALLDLTVSGGPLLVQYGFESEAGENSGSDALFNFDALLDFLEMKPYAFSLFLRQDHPDVTSGLAGRFLVKTNEYGASGVLRQPLSPVRVDWEAAHQESAGSGFGSSVDEDLDRANLRAHLPYGGRHNLRLALNWSDLASASGAPGIEIQPSTTTTRSAELRGENDFGAPGELTLRQNATWFSQDADGVTVNQSDSLGYTGALRWRHSDRTRSFFDLRYRDVDRLQDWSRGGSARLGAVHALSDRLSVSADGGYGRDEAPGFSQDDTELQTDASYSRPLPFGSLGLSLASGLTRTDRQADTDRVAVIDEPVTLVGTAPVRLRREFVVPGSVLVTNEARTQVFAEGVDYRLVTIGSTTSVERLVGGSIEDGETVLVSYEVFTGGTVEFDTWSNAFSANLALFRVSNVFFRYSDTRNDVLSGVSTNPLNDRKRMEYGARVDYPAGSGWSLGGEYRRTDNDEDIAPSVSDLYEVYVGTPAWRGTGLRLGVTREQTDNETSTEDIDLWRYSLGVTSLLPGRVRLSYNAGYREDDGGSLPVRSWDQGVRLDWSYRRLRFFLSGQRSNTEQGGSERTNTSLRAELRRDF